MLARIVPVIMCGGTGTRLWPVSRESMPKQFVPIVGSTSTFQQVLARVNGAELFARPIVITNADFRFVVAEQLRESGVEADIVLEPVRRDSGPAVAVTLDPTKSSASGWASAEPPLEAKFRPRGGSRFIGAPERRRLRLGLFGPPRGRAGLRHSRRCDGADAADDSCRRRRHRLMAAGVVLTQGPWSPTLLTVQTVFPELHAS